MAKMKWDIELKTIPAIFNKIAGLILPKYGEASFFSISVVSILFYIFNDRFREFFLSLGVLAFPFGTVLTAWAEGESMVMVLALFLFFLIPTAVVLCYLAGFWVSVYYNLAQKKFNQAQNFFALVFVLVTEIIIGIVAQFMNVDHNAAPGTELYTPIMGLVLIDYAILILLLARQGHEAKHFIISEPMDKKSIISSTLIALAVYLAGTYVLKTSWPMTFYSCIYFSTRIATFFRYKQIILQEQVSDSGR